MGGTWDTHRTPAADSPWPDGGAELLVRVLGRFEKAPQLAHRVDLLAQMDAAAGPDAGGEAGADGHGGFRLDVAEHYVARTHLRAIVRAVQSRTDPDAALAALRTAARALWPHDGALPWLQVTVLALTGESPLPTAPALRVVRELLPIGELPVRDQPTAAQLARHVPHGARGTALLTGRETLPEIVLRLADLRDGGGPAPLLRFLTAFAADPELAAHHRLSALRNLLGELRSGPGPEPTAAPGRLIVQIRVEAVDPEHVEDGRYELRGAYYRQPADGAPLRRLGSLPPSEPFRRSELTGAGSARISAWAELAREVRNAGGGVRLEFLLPTTLLGHSAEVWSAGASRTPLGHHHPVVVRSLERYTDPWIDPAPWRQRWDHLCADEPSRRDPACDDGVPGDGVPGDDVLDRIAWPPLDQRPASALTELLTQRPELACLGLTVPYDRLAAEIRTRLLDALFTEGLPVMVWRRDPGDAREVVTALRKHRPARLRDLPETVHLCRKLGRFAGEADVRNNMTLLYDDPDCVDADQDAPFAGMA
ncbi:hypothetical protein AB0M29_33320 [Streptomyces sp. NPDC051976]|uniref:VMAP-C domain-containing protein n=1 Tax=Streptomyces sp. NPDC051976 TaxID=3154947 RepID=UPI00342FB58F